LSVALAEMRIEGIATNLPLHRRLVTDADFARGGVSIHHLEGRLRREGAA
jgi:acetyl-CoA carboxylase biotin carboxylase subunit